MNGKEEGQRRTGAEKRVSDILSETILCGKREGMSGALVSREPQKPEDSYRFSPTGEVNGSTVWAFLFQVSGGEKGVVDEPPEQK